MQLSGIAGRTPFAGIFHICRLSAEVTEENNLFSSQVRCVPSPPCDEMKILLYLDVTLFDGEKSFLCRNQLPRACMA